MIRFLHRILPETPKKLFWASVLYTLIFVALLVYLSIFWLSQYGLLIFILVPFLLGALPVMLYSCKHYPDRRLAANLGIATFISANFLAFFLAFEGIMCLLMAFPITLTFLFTGNFIAYYFVEEAKKNHRLFLPILIVIPPVIMLDINRDPQLFSVTTSIEINADTKEVWENVVTFPELNAPEELMFRYGISYPINATIKGNGVGAVRYCNFNTGSFVEPITTWEDEKLLAFDVVEQPVPMQELSFWDIDAPHLHDFFVSKRGQFKLSTLPNGNTLLEGTTWYYNNIYPAFYWKWWSDYIIHKIHYRVLNHIKINAESK